MRLGLVSAPLYPTTANKKSQPQKNDRLPYMQSASPPERRTGRKARPP
jgi:hypothetical protein